MSLDSSSLGLFIHQSLFVFKIGLIIFASLYFIFTLIMIRQVNLMTETVQTLVSPILKIISVVYALFALAVVIFFVLAL